jgi:YD repeat-containing protein
MIITNFCPRVLLATITFLFLGSITYSQNKDLPLAEKLNRLRELDKLIASQRSTYDFASCGTPDLHGSNVGGGSGMNYYSGAYRHSIELANGVSINYYNNGIGVDQIASWVGLGWNLSVGGKITRNVKGFPDDLGLNTYFTDENYNTYFFQGWIRHSINPPIPSPANYVDSFDVNASTNDRSNNLEYFLSNTLPNSTPSSITKHDSEPDLFVFNYPGEQGSFVFSSESVSEQDSRKQIKPIVYNDSKMFYETNVDEITKFTIVDRSGTTYIFDIPERINTNSGIFPEDPTRAMFVNPDIPSFQSGTFSSLSSLQTDYVQSWFLSSIIMPDKSVITFEYDDEEVVLERNFYANYRNFNFSDTSDIQTQLVRNYPFDGYPSSILRTKRLSKIYSNDFEIDFIANTLREDLNTEGIAESVLPRVLDKIKVYTKVGSTKTLVKQIDLFYSYFDSHFSPNPEVNNKGYGIFSLGDFAYGEYIYKRLKLDEISIYNGNELMPPYKFDYVKDYDNNYWLPARYSYCQDAYGFFNSDNHEQTLVPKVWVYKNRTGQYRFSLYPLAQSSPGWTYPYILVGADRRPSSNDEDVSLGMLEKIVYPTGACTRIEYEQNDFMIDNIIENTFKGNGIRVKKISIGTEVTSGSSTYYTYGPQTGQSWGKMIAMPQFGHLDPNNIDCVNKFFTSGNQYVYWQDPEFNQYYIRGTANENELSEGIVGYSRVEETKDDMGGKMAYTFVNEATYNDYDPQNILYPDYQVSSSFVTPSRADYLLSTTIFNNPPQSIPMHIETETGLDFNSGSYPYPPNTNYSWHRGKPLTQEVYDANGQLVSSNENEYSFFYEKHGQGADIVYGLKNVFLRNNIPPKDDDTCGNTSTVYDFLFEPLTLSSKYGIHTGVDSYVSTSNKIYEPQAGHPISETRHFEHNDFGLLSSESFVDELGNIITTEYFYVCDLWYMDSPVPLNNIENIQTESVFNIIKNNRYALPVQTVSYKQVASGSTKYVMSSTYYQYKSLDIGNNETLEVIDRTYSLKNPGIIESVLDHPMVGENDNYKYELLFDTNYYKHNSTYSKYNSKGMPTEILEARGNPSAVIYAVDEHTPVFEASNALSNEILYKGFENNENSDWNFPTGCIIIEGQSKSGVKQLQIDPGIGVSKPVLFGSHITSEGYKASVWVKGSGNIKLSLNVNNSYIVKSVESNSTANWKLLTVSVDRTDLEPLIGQQITMLVSLQNIGANSMYVDDLLFVPNDAFYQTYVYDNQYRVTSSFDANNYYSSYGYDDLGRLVISKDNDGNILEVNDYFTGNPSDFVYYPVNPDAIEIRAGQSIYFIANLKTANSITFNFGDGTTYPTSTGLATHIFAESGTYTVSLNVTKNGFSYSTDRVIKVLPQ